MTKQVQRRRGTATQHTSFTGAEGELSVNTTNKSVHVHDGATAGGIELARKDGSNVAFTSGTLDGVTIGGTTAGAGTFTNLTATGTTTLAGASTSADITFGDNDKAIFGAGSDLQIYHDGQHSYIRDVGTGLMRLTAQDFLVEGSDGSDIIYGVQGGSTTIYHSGATKLATTSTGVDITGTAVTDGVTVAGNLSVDGGTIKLDGNYPVGSENVALGDTALDALTSGNQNTAIGSASLTNNTSGTYNTAIGREALKYNTTGYWNVGIGRTAAISNTSGNYNIAIGGNALSSNTTADNNTAVGYQAGYSNTTGTRIVAIGKNTYYTATTADDNVAIGEGAMYYTTTGSNNVSVGRSSMVENTTGASNVAIGMQALNANTTASDNTAVGYQALYNATTGAGRNTAIGIQAGYSTTTGIESTFVGRKAGYSTTGQRNTFIGREAGQSITTGANNTILGAYNGNQGGLDIRTSSNNIVLSDGDGNVGMYIDQNQFIRSKPIFAVHGTGLTRTTTTYDIPCPTNGGMYVVAFYGHDTDTATYNRCEINFIGHQTTSVSATNISSVGGNGDITFSKPSNNVLTVTMAKSSSSGTGEYSTVEGVIVYGGNLI
jgi:hypothetical protein